MNYKDAAPLALGMVWRRLGRAPPFGIQSAAVCRRDATERKFDDVVKDAEKAAVLVLVY